MTGKREIPSALKTVLNWDVYFTNYLVNFFDANCGPLIYYRNTFKYLEISCHGIPWLVVNAVLIFLVNFQFVRRFCVNLFIALLVDLVIVAVVKAFTRRRRPMGNTNNMFATVGVDKFSFPSGHATRAVMLFYIIPSRYGLIFPMRLLMLAWCSSICASRVLMRRHYFLDVIGGIVIGWLEGIFISNVMWLSGEWADSLVWFFLDETQSGASYDV